MRPSPLGSMPVDTFLSEYWQKKPLLIRNGFPDITSPVNAEVLAGLACEEHIESRLIIQHEMKNEWELKHGPFSEDTFSTLPKSCWTLLVQAVDHWIPEAAKFLDHFTFIPRWRIDDLMISYASDGGGVGPHFDNYDVFLVQTCGKRKWEVGSLCDENSPLRESMPVKILDEFEVHYSWILEPGDILYVPPGISHNGIAIGDDCITCSVGFRAPSHSEILREYTDYISEKLNESIRYEDPDLITQSNSGEISTQAIDKIQNILQKYIENEDLVSDWFARYISTPKYIDEQLAPQLESEYLFTINNLKKYLDEGKIILKNESSRFAYQTSNKQNILYVDGECFSDTSCDNNLIATLCNKLEFDNNNIKQSENNLRLLIELLQKGSLYLLEGKVL